MQDLQSHKFPQDDSGTYGLSSDTKTGAVISYDGPVNLVDILNYFHTASAIVSALCAYISEVRPITKGPLSTLSYFAIIDKEC